MRVLLDTDVILDLFLDRVPFADAATTLWQGHEQRAIIAHISAITPVNLFYIARKLKGVETAQQAIGALLAALPVCPVDYNVLRTGLALPFKDFEDAVQHASATTAHLEAIITRNVRDYTAATLPVYTPEAFLQHFPIP